MPNTPQSIDALPFGAYIRAQQLVPGILPFSNSTLWRKVRAGEFPKPVKLSERVTAWRVEDVRQWLADKAAA